ncbi:MAG: hypothetical protein ABW321_30715 [Polyangiales bacterium]
MALLRWPAATLALVLALAGCASSEELGLVDVWLSDCRGTAACGQGARSEHFNVQAYIDPGVSRHAPNGLYAYFELPRDDGHLAVVELDIPTAAPADEATLSYRELDGDRLVFEASDASGWISLPELLTAVDARSCGCEQGSFALRFRGNTRGRGEELRELTVGYLGRTEELCSNQLELRDDDEDLQVNVRRCPVSRPPSAAEPGPPAPPPAAPPTSRPCRTGYDCPSGYYDDDYYDGRYAGGGCVGYTDSGCGSSSSDDGCGDSSGDDGCGDSRDASSDGCGDGEQGDEDNDADGGCEGDTRDDSSSCSVRRAPRHRGSGLGTAIPLVLVCIYQLLRGARARRAATRRG